MTELTAQRKIFISKYIKINDLNIFPDWLVECVATWKPKGEPNEDFLYMRLSADSKKNHTGSKAFRCAVCINLYQYL